MQLVCNIMRGNNIESQHIVYAVAINEKGEILFSSGISLSPSCSITSFILLKRLFFGTTKSYNLEYVNYNKN